MGQLVYCNRRATLSIGNAQSVYTGQFVYCGRHVMLSIGDIPPLRRILEGAVIYNASARASRDYAIVVSRNPDSDASTRASGDYAIVTSHHPDNGIKAGNASHRRRSTANNGAVDDVRHPPAPLLFQRQRLLGKGGTHHLIYAG
ncbi:large ribosomal subunit protein uL2z-like [Miscanthus floridulus]|uniref:large ribosomal subunit protein uL2z-like n=1 Tax=Miscanthus floridulus TaxID=154761 RepID=UPI00345929BB